MRYKILPLFLSLTLLSAGAARAADLNCYTPMKNWQPRGAVQKSAANRGWKVHRIKIDDGCYQITGWNSQGLEIEARVDPATLEVISLETEKAKLVEDTETNENTKGFTPVLKRNDE